MIQCSHIAKSYHVGDAEVPVLQGVTFTIKTGEFVAIMGPSGSGKSTLMNILGCLDYPTSGSYILDGIDVSRLSDDALARIRNTKIGFVFQAFNLLRRASVLRNVALPLVYADVERVTREERSRSALRSVSFPETFIDYLPNQLSGGMMQRVAIARALVNNPLIILADEPTGNLDTKTGEIVLDTFQHLNMNEGRTIVLITHELYVAQHAQRIISIRDGAIIEDTKVEHRRITNNHHHENI